MTAIDTPQLRAAPQETASLKTTPNNSDLGLNKLFKTVSNENKEAKKPRTLAEGSFIEFTYVTGDVLGVIRKTDEAYNAAMYNNPTSGVSNGIFLGSGVTQMVTGALQFERGLTGVKKSSQNGDNTALTTSSIRVARGVTETVTGGATAATAGITIANATSNTSKALNILGWLATVGSTFTSGAVMVVSAMGLMESFSVSTKLSEAKNTKEAFQVLKNKLLVTDEDKEKILDGIFSGKKDPWYSQIASSFTNVLFRLDPTKEKEKLKLQENLQEILKDPAKLSNLQVDDFKSASSLSDQDKAFIMNYLSENPICKGLEKEKLAPLLQVIYQDGLGRLIDKKEAVFKRTVGAETFKLIKQHINDSVADDVMENVVKSAKHEITINQRINLAGTLLGALGVAVTLMTQFATGGVYTLVELGIGLATSLAWVFVDGYSLYQEFKNNPCTTKDKIVMTLGLLTTFATTILAVVVTRITSQLAPALALITLSTLCLLYVVYKWKKASKEPPKTLANSATATPSQEVKVNKAKQAKIVAAEPVVHAVTRILPPRAAKTKARKAKTFAAEPVVHAVTRYPPPRAAKTKGLTSIHKQFKCKT